MDITQEWIEQLIEKNELHKFYIWGVWKKTSKHVLKENHYECQRCKAKGIIRQATVVHHKKYLREYPELALDYDNLEALCEECHYIEHHTKQGYVNEERW